ncbi:DsbA family protein [Nocardioides sp.]|uniref:DsbA family oxidoreductase n=1 Tax=Nocardioides sp. TaxID=35761 RepID=UPI00262CDF37|nr:DsbA family protein [Nocardioides sp.]MDI6912254.1 DsbA family protein [Nocardioides sp.]
MDLVIYADFGSPACALASARADALTAADVQVDWRAVEPDPRLPVGGVRMGASERDALERELEAVAGLLLPGEELPGSVPAFRPNGRGPVAGYAEAYGAGVADDVRRLLFSAYWSRGQDIGSPEVLRRLLAGPILRGHATSVPLSDFGLAVSPSRGPITMAAFRRIRDWSAQWRALNAAPLPLLVVDGRLPVAGETALRRLEKELDRAGATVRPVLPDPGRYPVVPDPPALPWVSANGGPWRHAFMVGA